MKKVALFLTCVSISAFAGIDERIDTLEQEMGQISARTPQDTLGVSFTPDQPQISHSNWFLTFDVIYWHTKMGGTEYAYSLHTTQTNAAQNTTALPVDGDTKDNDFGWDIGLKVGLGYKLSQHDDWDIYTRYTWFETEDSDSSYKYPPSSLVSLTWFGQVYAERAKSHIDVNYNNIDLELGRSYFQSSQLSLRPHFDIKSTWIDSNRDVVYTSSPLSSDDPTLVGFDFKTKEDIHFWGLGPRVGLDTKWYLGYGFNLFAEGAASVLYGHFKTKQRDFFPPHTVASLDPTGKAFSMKHEFHRFIPFAQLHFGLAWGTYVNSDKQHLGFKLGYEVQYYWRYNQAHQPEDTTTFGVFVLPNIFTANRIQFEKQPEDLMFYGITGEFRLDF